MRTSIFAAAVSAGLLLAGGVQAAELVNGAYYGSGNDYTPGNWTVSTSQGIELGLRGHIRYPPTAAPAPVGNVYIIPLNSIASYDWSFDNLTSGLLTGLTSMLTITNAAGGSASYDALLGGHTANPNGLGGGQDSARLNFSFLNGGMFNVGNINYDAALNSTYNVTFSVSGTGFTTVSDSIVIQQGSGFAAVPEPAAWALMLLGFGGIGMAIRRRRATHAFA